jgi:hypothetical protein
LRAANILARAGAAHLRAFITGKSPEREAKAMFGADERVDFVLKAATGPAAIAGTPEWAANIAPVSIYGMVADITSISAAAALIDRGLKLDMDHVAELRVPGRTLNAAAAGMWVAEEDPAPVRQLVFLNAAVLQPRKLSVLAAYTRTQAESSNIEAIVRQTLGEAAGLALDQKMLSADAATTGAPAGLFFGTTPLTPATGAGQAAMVGDIEALIDALAANGAGAAPVFVCAAKQAAAMKTLVGPKFDYPIFASTSLPAGTVAAVEVASFVSAFSPVPEFSTSPTAAVHFEDTSPQDITGGSPSPAVPVRSAFQTESILLKMDLRAAFGLRAAGHAQWVQNVTW